MVLRATNGNDLLPEIQILAAKGRGGVDSEEDPMANDVPPKAACSSGWQDRVLQISMTERLRFEDARRNEAEKLELQRQVLVLKQEKETAALRHRTELEMRRRDLEKRNREAWLQLRRENTELEEGVRQAQTRAHAAQMRREEVELNVETLMRKASKLEEQCRRREAEAEKEIDRVKGERNASYKRTEDRAEQRVQAMRSLLEDAQDKMQKNEDFLERERRRLTIAVDKFPPRPEEVFEAQLDGGTGLTGNRR